VSSTDDEIGRTCLTYRKNVIGCTVTPVYAGQFWFHSQPPNLNRWSSYGNQLILWKVVSALSLLRMYNLRVWRQVVELESRYLTLSMNKYLNYNKRWVATRKFQFIVHTFGERMETAWLRGSYANEWGFLPNTVQLFRAANIGRSNLDKKQSTKRETVVKLWSKDHVYYRNLLVP